MREFFQRRAKFRPRAGAEPGEVQIPEDLWVKCPRCQELVYTRELERNAKVCPKCAHHFRLGARERLAYLLDEGSFVEWDADVQPVDRLHFVDGAGSYELKLRQTQTRTGETESLITGRGTVAGRPVTVTVSDFDFLGASMGAVFGEKLARAVDRGSDEQVPVLTISSSGGARMHEGIISLMQMATTVAAMGRLGRARVPHISLLVDPCYGGVTASYATIADVILAEPGALIGFAGPRVIEQITKQKLPAGFQTAEFLLDHGMIDAIVPRLELRSRLVQLLDLSAVAPANGRRESGHREQTREQALA